MFLRIIHTEFRSSHMKNSTLKRLHWISFLVKIAYFKTAFLRYTSRYVFLGKSEKQQNYFKILRYLTCEELLLRLEKVLKFQTLACNSELFSNVLYSRISIQYQSGLEPLR